MKLHLGSGTVYLRDWVNVDLPSERTYLASERPDLIERYITDETDYYARHSDKTIEKLRKGPLSQETVCDRFGSLEFLPLRQNEASEILLRHVFEHCSIREARRALIEMHNVLRKDGLLRIDVPDHDESLKIWARTKDPFYIRHILGPRRDDHGDHIGYTRDRLRKLAELHGFSYVHEEPNIHFFPAFCLRFMKD